MKIAIVIGHSLEKQGASSDTGITEYQYNNDLSWIIFNHMVNICMSDEKRIISGIDFRRFKRTSNISNLIKEIKLYEADITISLHCNSVYDKSIRGTEVLIWNEHYDNPDKKNIVNLANDLSKRISLLLNTRNRGIKKRNPFERGGKILSEAPNCFLIESFFISNLQDFEAGMNNQEALGKLIGGTIIEFVMSNKNLTKKD